MSVVNQYNLFINSTQRLSGTSNDFTLNITPALTLSSSHHYFQIRMVSCCIPYSFKQVNIFNNNFSYYYYDGFTTQLRTIVIPPGNYNINSLMARVKLALESDILAGTGDTVVFNFTYNSDTYLTTFSFVSTTGQPSSLISFPYASQTTLSKMLGWNQDHNNVFVGLSFDSDQPVNVNPITSIYLRSDSLNQIGSKESLVEKNTISDILAEIPVLVLPGSFIVSQNPGAVPVRLTNRTIDRIQLYLSSSDNYALNLNGLDYTVGFLIEEVQMIMDEPDPTLATLAQQKETASKEQALKDLQQKREQILAELKQQRKELLSSIKNEQSEVTQES